MRNPLLAKVHIARKDLALAEESYRALLARVTGKTSAADCSDGELDAVLTEFKRVGWAPRAKRRPLSNKPHVRKVFALWGELRPHLRDGSTRALCAFVRRQTGLEDPEWLSPDEANSVIEALKKWLHRVRPGSVE